MRNSTSCHSTPACRVEEVETSKGVGLAVMTAAEGASVVVQRPPLEASALLDMHGNGRLCAADPFALQQSKPIAILQTTQVDKTGSDEEKEEEAVRGHDTDRID